MALQPPSQSAARDVATFNLQPSTFNGLAFVLGLLLCLTLSAVAQPRTGAGGGATTAGGGISGGGLGGARTGGTSGTTARTYPNAGSIGDAYFSIDPETRRVVTIADEETSKYISQVLSNLDRPKPQVLIKVAFLEVNHNNASDIGIEGGWGKQGMNGTVNAGNAANVFGLGSLTSPATNVTLNALGQPTTSFINGSPFTMNAAGLYQLLGQDYQVTLRAIAQAGNVRVLSRPTILARNNQPASIHVGQSVPLVTSTSFNGLNGTPINSYTYQSVGVILNVTPFITADGLVEMIVSPQVSSIDPTLAITVSAGVTAPVIDVRSADTVAVVEDGQTVVIGGLMQSSKSQTDTKIPVLGDVPLLGALFKRRQKSDAQTELVILLTPHVVQAPSQLAVLSAAERRKSDALKSASEQELDTILDRLPTKDPTGIMKSGKSK
jgi:general secretion pathway protein D